MTNPILQLLKFSKPSSLYGLTGGVLLIISGLLVYAVPIFIKYIFDTIIPQKNFKTILILSLLLLVIYLIKSLLAIVGTYMSNKYAHSTLGNIQKNLLFNILLYDGNILDKYKPGDLSSRITSDIYILRNLMIETVLSLAKNVFVILVGLVLMALINPLISLFIGVALIINYFTLYFINKLVIRKTRKVRTIISKMTGKIIEVFNSIFFIKTYLLENQFISKLNSIINKYIHRRLSLDTVHSVYREANSFISVTIIIIITLFISYKVIFDNISIGSIMSLLFIIQYIMGAYSGISSFSFSYAEARVSFQRINDILILKTVPELKGKGQIFNGDIKMKNLFFSYVDAKETQRLTNINLTIEAGDKIAIVGESGSGKSTLIKLLLKFYKDYNGVINIDGVSLSEISCKDVRQNITYVPQNAFVMDDTIWNNISIVNTNVSERKIKGAISKARLSALFQQNGRDYLVGWQGEKLSGGEKQRIGLARAFLKDASILIIDEATSQLDSVSDLMIHEAFQELWKNKTAIVIAHRLSTIIQMDRIIVMKNGKILAQGKHDELFKECEYYRKLCETQYIQQNALKV